MAYPSDEARRARATIYPLKQARVTVYRFLVGRCKPHTAPGRAALYAYEALSKAESAARQFPIDPTGL